jgi:hypothetical protein
MNSLLQDTTPQQVATYYRLLRALSPAQRMRIVGATTSRMRTMAEAGIRRRHPGASEAELRDEFVELLYGREVRARLSGKLPR